jgi:hypothetical protein
MCTPRGEEKEIMKEGKLEANMRKAGVIHTDKEWETEGAVV